MRKLIKAAAICLAAVMLVAMAASCGKKGDDTSDPDKKAYVFTVVCEDTKKPVEGVQVQICKGDDFCLMPVATDKDGVAEYELTGDNDFDEYDVHIIGGIPDGYTFDNSSVKTDAKTKSYTLTLIPSESESESDSESDSESADDSTSGTDKETDKETGKDKDSTSSTATGTNSSTSGSNSGSSGSQGSSGSTSTQQKSYTVKVVYDSDCVDSAGKSHKAGEAISGVSLVISNADGSKIISKGSSDSKGEYRFTAVQGSYYIHVSGGLPSGFTSDEAYGFADNSTVTTVGIFMQIKSSGDRLPFNPVFLKNGVALKDSISSARANDSLSTEDESYYYYAFRPTGLSDEGMYRATVKLISGSATLKIARFTCSAAYIYATPEQQSTGKEAYIDFKIEKDYITDIDGNFSGINHWLIGVKAEGSPKYPITYEVKIEKIRDLVPGKDYPIKVRHTMQIPAGSLSADAITGAVSGKLTSVPMNSTLVRDSQGYYHVGSASGPYAMVTINAPNMMLNNDPNVFFSNINDSTGVEQACLSETVTENGITTLHYYEYYSALKEYAALCNSDGAYVINDQLLTFLKGYASQRRMETAANAYLLGVSYYK